MYTLYSIVRDDNWQPTFADGFRYSFKCLFMRILPKDPYGMNMRNNLTELLHTVYCVWHV